MRSRCSSTTVSAWRRSSTTRRCSTTRSSSRRSARPPSLALENARLQAELRAQLAEVRASRARIVEAGDAERRRLERDLHDGAQQRLLGIRLALQLARGQLADGGALSRSCSTTRTPRSSARSRSCARSPAASIRRSSPTKGSLPLLPHLRDARRVPVELAVCAERLPAPVEATAYFVAAEALANVVKHAGRLPRVIHVTRTNGRLVIDITDDGNGGADADGAGLRGLRDRVEALDGHLAVESPPGGGTRVTAAIPCA